ncbi:MAG: SH3 domain-containing protein [Bacteroidetes bacterium]|nr:SH3 domain-containing protein [Bacteroidota bacterium]
MNLILGVLGLYVCSRLYSSVTGKTPTGRFNLTELKEAFQKNSGVWWFMVPVAGLLILFFEAILGVLWFIGEILQLAVAVVKIAVAVVKWIYNEVIIAGFYFVWKLIWHYVVCIPWGWFRESFRLIGDASKWSSYKIACYGIFASLLVAFLGRYINFFLGNDHTTLQGFIQHGTTLLSIIPIGMAASMIAYNRKNSGATWKSQGMNYAKLAVAILAPMIILIGVEYLLINMGSRTSFQFSHSTFLAGGSLLASLLIIINSILLIFVISALPSFANSYTGDIRGVYRAFFTHVYYGWASYLLVIPAIIIPAFILSIIPGLVTQGVTYFTQKATDSVYEDRIASIQADSNETIASYTAWCNVDSVSGDSLNKLMEADKRMLATRVSLSSVERGKEYLNASYSTFANRNGAVTVGLLAYMYNNYCGLVNENLKAQPISSEAKKDSTFEVSSKSLNEEVVELDSSLVRNNRTIASLEIEKAAVCVDAAPADQPTAPTTPDTPQVVNNETADECTAARQRLDDAIADIQTENAKIQQRKERKLAVLAHVNGMQEEANALNSNEGVAKNLGYLFMSIWLCALAALALGYVLSIYSHINSVVFDSVDNSDWMITTQIRDAHAANKNQPLLGILLTIVASLMLFGWVSSMELTEPKAIWDKANEKVMEYYGMIPVLNAAAPAPAPAASPVAEEIKVEEEVVEEEVVIEEEPAVVEDQMLSDLYPYRIEDPDGFTNLRDAPNGTVIRRVYPNEQFSVVVQYGQYVGVQFPDGTAGYIHMSRVVPINS